MLRTSILDVATVRRPSGEESVTSSGNAPDARKLTSTSTVVVADGGNTASTVSPCGNSNLGEFSCKRTFASDAEAFVKTMGIFPFDEAKRIRCDLGNET